jgi:type IV fimbrial biogenesis protein FimT
MRRAARRRGFSLAELMTALAIGAIVFALALPEMGAMLRRQRLRSNVNDLFDAIELTRTEAIVRGGRVELVPADPAAADWRQGWIVFVDRDGDRRPGPGDEIILAHGPLAEGILVASTFSGAPDALYVAYNDAGRGCTDTSSRAARWGTLSLFQGTQTRRIKINMLGRARVCDPARDGASCAGIDPPA